MPAPTDDLRPIVGQLTCQFQPGQSSMKTVYAGLAPLMIGLYQAIFQMPPDAGKAPISGLQCTASGPGGQGSFLILGAIPAPGSNLRMQTSSQPAPCDWIKPAEIGETREIGIGGSQLGLILDGQCSEVS